MILVPTTVTTVTAENAVNPEDDGVSTVIQHTVYPFTGITHIMVDGVHSKETCS